MVNNAVIWFEIMVQDMARAKAFYESVFQVKLERLNTSGFEMWSFPVSMERPGVGGALVKMEGVPPGENSGTKVYFSCADCVLSRRLLLLNMAERFIVKRCLLVSTVLLHSFWIPRVT